MVSFTTLSLTAISLLAPSALAKTGKASIVNQCDYDVTLHVVGSEITDVVTITPGKDNAWSETYWRDDKTGGIALKITKEEDGLFTGDPQIIFSYTLDPDRIWYDLSTIYGDLVEGEKLLVEGQKGSKCPVIEVGGEERMVKEMLVADCKPSDSVTLTLCA